MSIATSGAPRARNGPSAPLQWTVLILLVVSVGINYIDRGNLSVASFEVAKELRLDPAILGQLFAAFFWTYAGFMIFAGWMVEKFNVIWVYAAGYAIWSAATLVTGFVDSFVMLFALRLVLGMSESVAYPSYSKIISAGFPERQRGIANGLIDAGSKLGPALGLMIGGTILANWGWRSLFLSIGAISLIWLVPWCLIAPKIQIHQKNACRDAPSFGELLSKRDVWASFVCLFAGNYGWYFLLTWIPGYLRMERHYSAEAMALIGSLPFWAVAAGAVTGGLVADSMIHAGRSTTVVRKSFVAFGLAGSAILFLPAAIIPGQFTAMVFLIIASFVYGLFSGNNWAVTQTLAGPVAAGKWTGLQNCAGNMAGIAAPIVTGYIVNQTQSFFLAFVWVSIIMGIGAVTYVFGIGKVETHQWRKVEPAVPRPATTGARLTN